MGNTWEPGRERFWDVKETFEYVDSRSFALGDGFTVASVKMGGRALSGERVFGEVGVAMLQAGRIFPSWIERKNGENITITKSRLSKGYGEGSFSRVA